MDRLLAVVLTTVLSGFVIVGASNVEFFRIIQEVNAASPEGERISPWKAGLRARRFFRRHRELFPESKRLSRMNWLSAIGSFLFFGAMIFGIFATNAGWIKNRDSV
jgi:hypothetical protein